MAGERLPVLFSACVLFKNGHSSAMRVSGCPGRYFGEAFGRSGISLSPSANPVAGVSGI